MILFKEKVKQFYSEILNTKVNTLRKQQDDLKESLLLETKSTAGDKYETSRAMLHMEQENIAVQLVVLLQQKAILDSIDVTENLPPANIQFGSLIKTNKGFIFLAVALGKALIEDQNVFAISPASPLGKLLMGKKINEKVNIQTNCYEIETIC